VTDAATAEPQIHQWLTTPDAELSLAANRANTLPVSLLGSELLRQFLMNASTNRQPQGSQHARP
jgi:hypothetical protein